MPPKRDAVASLPENIVIRSVLVGSLLLYLSAAGYAADVHKCATPSGITYQGLPCNGPGLPIVVASTAQTPAAPSSSASNNAGARATPDCDASPRQALRRLPWRYTTLCIGITDDEVLNLRGWGPPVKIIRTRAPREWHEEWTYDARAAGPRQLHFVNGKLAAVETDFLEPSVASLAPN